MNRRLKKSSLRHRSQTDPDAPIRLDWFNFGTKTLVLVIGLSLGAVLWAMSVPEYDTLKQQQAILRGVESAEQAKLSELDENVTERQSLLNDPIVLESYARDRLDWAKPGERIIRIERE